MGTGSATAWFTVGNIIRAGAQWFLLVLVARWSSPDVAAEYVLLFALTGPLFIFSELGLRTVYLTRSRRPSWAVFLWTRIICSSVAVLVCLLLSGMQGLVSPRLLVLLALIKAIDSLTEMCLAPLQLEERYRFLFALAVANSLASLIAGGLVFYLTVSLAWLLVTSMVCSVAVGATAILSQVGHRGRKLGSVERIPQGSTENMFAVLKSGLPLGISFSLATLMWAIPQYVLSVEAHPARVTEFAILIYAVVASELFLNGLAQGALPSLVALRERAGPAAMARSATWIAARATLGFAAPAVVGVAAGPAAIAWVYGSDYQVGRGPVALVVALILVGPSVFLSSAACTVLNAYWGSALTNGAAAASVTCAAIWLTPSMGLTGACWAVFIAAVVRASIGILIVLFEMNRSSRDIGSPELNSSRTEA